MKIPDIYARKQIKMVLTVNWKTHKNRLEEKERHDELGWKSWRQIYSMK